VADGLASDDADVTVTCQIITVYSAVNNIVKTGGKLIVFFGGGGGFCLCCQRKQLQISPATARGYREVKTIEEIALVLCNGYPVNVVSIRCLFIT